MATSYLCATHVLVWSLFEPKKLPGSIKKILLNPENSILVSIVSLWEISIKFRLGKLNPSGCEPEDILKSLLQMGFQTLDFDPGDAISLHRLQQDHHGALRSRLDLAMHSEEIDPFVSRSEAV